jgi:hypothetical protein
VLQLLSRAAKTVPSLFQAAIMDSPFDEACHDCLKNCWQAFNENRVPNMPADAIPPDPEKAFARCCEQCMETLELANKLVIL